MSSSRQLAAIMFTDIVGYTALMGRDEQKAFEYLNKNRQIQRPIIEQHGGHWIKELGDGVLASFSTVSDAVRAAIKIQEACNIANEYQLRIGIHQGEVVVEEDDVFGDTVNIASRIQSVANPGSIYVSDPIYHNVSNKLDIKTVFIKEEILKNVKEPIRIYEIITSAKQQVQGHEAKVISEKSIAVLPFANMSSDPEQDFFSDGISEEIINMLAQVGGLKVAGRTSSFTFKSKNQDLRSIGQQLGVNYILEGSVRKSGNKLRITAQLITASDGYHVWSEKYDRQIEDIFDIQDEIALAILDVIKIKLFNSQKDVVTKRYTNNPEAYQLYLQGRYYYAKWGGSDRFNKTIECYNEAIKIEPEYALAYTGLAECYLGLWFFRYLPPEETLRKMKESILRSLAIDNTIAETHIELARMNHWYEWNFPEAEREYKISIELNPNSASAHEQYGMLLSILGRRDEAIKNGEKAVSLEPFSDNIGTGLAWSYWFLGDFNHSLAQGKRLMEYEPAYWAGHLLTGLNLVSMGRYNDALPELKIAAEQNPGSFTAFHIALASGLMANMDKTQSILEQLLASDLPVGNFELGMVHAILGKNDEAIQYFSKAVDEHEGMMTMLRNYVQLIPGFNTDPRLSILYKKIGLPQPKTVLRH